MLIDTRDPVSKAVITSVARLNFTAFQSINILFTSLCLFILCVFIYHIKQRALYINPLTAMKK